MLETLCSFQLASVSFSLVQPSIDFSVFSAMAIQMREMILSAVGVLLLSLMFSLLEVKVDSLKFY